MDSPDPERKDNEPDDWASIMVGVLSSLLVEKGVCSPEEIQDRYLFCLSDYDQYSAECRDLAAGETDA